MIKLRVKTTDNTLDGKNILSKPKDKTSSEPLAIEEFEDLLEKVVLKEVTDAVWGRFEQALSKLDPEGLSILEEHLDGADAEKISASRKISQKDAKSLVGQMKRDLIRHLRKDCNVRH